jgi:hypothetical protein
VLGATQGLEDLANQRIAEAFVSESMFGLMIHLVTERTPVSRGP